jgi:hypothetical protein
MKTKIFTILFLSALFWMGAKAQTYPLVTIHDIQFIPLDTLKNCHEKSPLLGDTVRVRGTAYIKGNQSTAYLSGKISTAREIYIQDGSGPWSGLDVFTSGAGSKTFPVDIQSLVPGDSIEVTGVVSEFSGQSEVIHFFKTKGGATFSNQVKYLGTAKIKPNYHTIKLSDLNNSNQINQLSTGEQWESGFIELRNVTVTAASAQNASRIQFTVADSAGNSAIIFDKFLVQRNSANPDTFKVPHVGDILSSPKGVVAHFASGGPTCTSGTYEIYPFDTSHYHYSLSAPLILSVTRKPLVPKSSDDVLITANVTPFANRGIKNVVMMYKAGSDTSVFNGYTSVVMTLSGANYIATIPKMADGTTVKYYVTAVDTISKSPLRSYSPAIKTPGIFPYFYTVRDGGLTIYDVQYRPNPASVSGYNNLRVVVSGVVTASIKDLGYFYIQQPGLNAWAAINLKGSTQLVNFNTGDYVIVGGTVSEASNYTTITVDSIVKATGSFTIKPIPVIDTLLTKGDLAYRKYMQMLVTLKPVGSKLKVVQLNADAPSNFGDYRVGEDVSKPTIGTRVTAGNNSANDPGSLNVSYVNDATWFPNLKVKSYRAVTTSDNMDSLSGIMLYNFSNYKVMPRTNADFYNITNPVVGIENADKTETQIRLYPNPSEGTFNIDLSGAAMKGNIRLQITDLTGRIINIVTIPSGTTRYALQTNLKPGAYMLSFISEKGLTAEARLLINK